MLSSVHNVTQKKMKKSNNIVHCKVRRINWKIERWKKLKRNSYGISPSLKCWKTKREHDSLVRLNCVDISNSPVAALCAMHPIYIIIFMYFCFVWSCFFCFLRSHLIHFIYFLLMPVCCSLQHIQASKSRSHIHTCHRNVVRIYVMPTDMHIWCFQMTCKVINGTKK